MRYPYLLACLILAFSSCQQSEEQGTKKSNQSLAPNTGHMSELVVVVSDELWAGEVGAEMRVLFEEAIKGLPQQEALFDIYSIEKKDFSSIFKAHKNIIWLSTDKSVVLERTDGKWAQNQLFVNIAHQTEAQLAEAIKVQGPEIRSWFVKKNISRRVTKIKSKRNKELEKSLRNEYQVKMSIPKGYYLAEQEEKFVWIRRDNSKENITSNLMIFTQDYTSPNQLGLESLIRLRDSLGMAHVEGSKDQSYMATERLYEPDYRLLSNNPYTIETRGLWTMANDFMGGAFISYAMIDEKNQRMIYAEGFLYCPKHRKREYFQELEAMLSTIKALN